MCHFRSFILLISTMVLFLEPFKLTAAEIPSGNSTSLTSGNGTMTGNSTTTGSGKPKGRLQLASPECKTKCTNEGQIVKAPGDLLPIVYAGMTYDPKTCECRLNFSPVFAFLREKKLDPWGMYWAQKQNSACGRKWLTMNNIPFEFKKTEGDQQKDEPCKTTPGPSASNLKAQQTPNGNTTAPVGYKTTPVGNVPAPAVIP